jgi:hypothetical protein
MAGINAPKTCIRQLKRLAEGPIDREHLADEAKAVVTRYRSEADPDALVDLASDLQSERAKLHAPFAPSISIALLTRCLVVMQAALHLLEN